MSLHNSLRMLTYCMKHIHVCVCVCTWLHCPYVLKNRQETRLPIIAGSMDDATLAIFLSIGLPGNVLSRKETAWDKWHLLKRPSSWKKKHPFLDFGTRHQHATLPIRSLPLLRQRLYKTMEKTCLEAETTNWKPPLPALGHYSHSSHSMPSSGKGTPESCSHRKTSIEINNRYMNKKSTNIEIRCIDERSKYIQLTQSQADRVT